MTLSLKITLSMFISHHTPSDMNHTSTRMNRDTRRREPCATAFYHEIDKHRATCGLPTAEEDPSALPSSFGKDGRKGPSLQARLVPSAHSFIFFNGRGAYRRTEGSLFI